MAGPMRGLPNYGFDRFDAAAKELRNQGLEVVSPAELDRAVGFDETGPLPDGFVQEAFRRDFTAIAECDAIVVLPGWQQSAGTLEEIRCARLMGMPVLDYETLDEIAAPPERTVMDEAKEIVFGPRAAAYGHPRDNFARTAQIWSVVLGIDVTPEQVGLCMIGLKLAREVHHPTRDNLVDLCGYVGTIERLAEPTT